MVIVINSMIGEFSWVDFIWSCHMILSDHRCPITANCPIKLSDYTCTEWLVKYKAADAPITFEEIVSVMISLVITVASFSLVQWDYISTASRRKFRISGFWVWVLRNVNMIQSLSTVIFLSDLSLSCTFIKSVYIQ